MVDTGTRRPTSEEVEQAKTELKTEIHLPTHRAGLIYCSCGHDAFESIYKFSLHRVAVFERIAFVLLAEIEGSR